MLKSRILYGFIFVLSILFVICYPGKMSYITVYSVLGLLVFSMLSAFLAKYFIVATEIFDNKFVFKGEELFFKVNIVNKSVFSYPQVSFVFYNEEFTTYNKTGELAFSMEPKEKKEIDYKMEYKYRGVYKAGIKCIIILDCLGIFRFKHYVNKSETITVYPSRYDNFILELRRDLLNKALSSVELYKDQYAEMSDVRKHEPNDDFKKIHWKLTAKKNEFMVKNYQATAISKTMVILNVNNINIKAEERIILEDRIVSYVASAIYYCCSKKLPVDFIYGHSHLDRIFVDNQEELNAVYHLLSGIEFNSKEDFTQMLEKVFSHEEGFYNIVIFTTEVDKRLCEVLKNLVIFGHHIILFYFDIKKQANTENNNYIQELILYGVKVMGED